MKKIQTNNHRNTTIGTSKRTIGSTVTVRDNPPRKINKSKSVKAMSKSKPTKSTIIKSVSRVSSASKRGCSGCSRSARKK